jgi:hypothetical protein
VTRVPVDGSLSGSGGSQAEQPFPRRHRSLSLSLTHFFCCTPCSVAPRLPKSKPYQTLAISLSLSSNCNRCKGESEFWVLSQTPPRLSLIHVAQCLSSADDACTRSVRSCCCKLQYY